MNQRLIDREKVVIGSLLYKLHKEIGISYSQLKRESGLDANQIRGIMNGSAKYRIDSLIAICQALEVDLFDLKNIEK